MNLIREISNERDRQVEKWGGAKHDDNHLPADWITIITAHLGKASTAAMGDGDRQTRLTLYHKQLIRVAALCIAALESNYRQIKALNADLAKLSEMNASTNYEKSRPPVEDK